ncbi:DEAD/DEAH box helicase [Paenibacillus sp. YN15]|uniref:DEAD/DEAH box helicase n=1 Tax=Paenibacillus sp. YN15 TaxID=1742774 RepID=UPI000DCC18AF|nr:DEAD/DEAH box helicase [Paenibacillus sp. YN15]RAV04053.1 ATP-dependent helicase [Paenibacillus sp. YN15]
MTIHTFEALPLRKALIQNVRSMNITEPTPIQQEAIPVILEGRDLIAQSQTGSGKTLAYALPVLERIDPALKKQQALILVPTRELGAQIFRVMEQAAKDTGAEVQLLIGGASISRQIDRLRLHPQVVIGTPGRVLELIKLRKLSMHHIKTIIVDEADHIFEQGEGREVETVIKSAMRDRQLCFFSATIPDPVRQLADRWMRDPVSVQIEPEHKTASTLTHLYVVTSERERIDTLRRLVKTLEPRSGMVFTNQVSDFGEILAKLQYAGLSIEGLYSEAGKQDRAKVMKDFREGRLQLLLATDVAARGLDIPEVTHVFHFDLPVDADHYVHRSGRTGRMGRQGVSVSLCAPNQLFILEKFSKSLGVDFEKRVLFEGRLSRQEELPKRLLHQLEGSGQSGRGGRAPVVDRTRGAAEARDSTPELREEPREKGGRAVGASRQGAEAAYGDRRGAGAPAAGGREKASGPRPQEAKARVPARGGKVARKADQKNKGAPRWLKEKRGSQE